MDNIDVLITWRLDSNEFKNIKNLKMLQIWGSGKDKIDCSLLDSRTIIKDTNCIEIFYNKNRGDSTSREFIS